MFNNIQFVDKEIYVFGKKEIHNVLCIEKVADNGESYFVPLTCSKKGKDGKYYQTYIYNDTIKNCKVASLAYVFETNKKVK